MDKTTFGLAIWANVPFELGHVERERGEEKKKKKKKKKKRKKKKRKKKEKPLRYGY